jgi:hypothetical protein
MFLNLFCIFSGVSSGLFIGIYLREKGFSSSVRNSFSAFSGLDNNKGRGYVKGSVDHLFSYYNEEKTRGLDMNELFKAQLEKDKKLNSVVNSRI